MPKRTDIKRVLLIGSGPIQIGQAAEFDFSGTQACRALREEGIEVVLVNSNPATIQTDPDTADVIYVEPLKAEIIARIIEKERPDGILSGMGGQTGLNMTAELAEMGALKGVEILGTPLEAIYRGEDREQFKDLMQAIGEPVPRSMILNSADQIAEALAEVGLPAIIRPAYTLGGAGGGVGPHRGRAPPDRRTRPPALAHPPGPRRGVGDRLEGGRVRGDAGQERLLPHRLRHGERGRDGHPYGRVGRGRPDPDPPRRRVPDAQDGLDQDHPRARRPGRLQHPVSASRTATTA